MRLAGSLFLVLTLLVVQGCRSYRSSCGGLINAPPVPLITIEEIVSADGSGRTDYPYRVYPLPVYPGQLLREGVTGEVWVRVWVDQAGSVSATRLLSVSHAEFGPAVSRAVAGWRFTPNPTGLESDFSGMVLDCLVRFAIK